MKTSNIDENYNVCITTAIGQSSCNKYVHGYDDKPDDPDACVIVECASHITISWPFAVAGTASGNIGTNNTATTTNATAAGNSTNNTATTTNGTAAGNSTNNTATTTNGSSSNNTSSNPLAKIGKALSKLFGGH